MVGRHGGDKIRIQESAVFFTMISVITVERRQFQQEELVLRTSLTVALIFASHWISGRGTLRIGANMESERGGEGPHSSRASEKIAVALIAFRSCCSINASSPTILAD